MKKYIKFFVLISAAISLLACTNEDIVVHYAASTPQIDTAKVVESQITYGDSIHIKLSVSDKVAPLSTLQLRVVCNNEIVASETFRTKGNSTNIAKAYRVPFVANRPDNTPVKVYLTLTNVEGYTKDSIVSTTIAKRPVINGFWLVPDGSAKGIKLNLTDATNLIYYISGLTYGTTINYKIATKVKGLFNKVDWSGLVFGKVGDGIGLVDSLSNAASNLSIITTDATLVGISNLTFDALKFTVKAGGKLLEPVKTLDINADLLANPASLATNTNFRGGNVYFGEGVVVTFTGITNLANNLSPDYFEVTGANTAKFLGKTGLYKAYYLTTTSYLYIEPQPEAIYPDAIWICGQGFGRPQTPYTTTGSWNWNSPLDYAPCRLMSPGIYQVTIYCKNTATTGVNGSLNFKFFDKRGWWDGHEELSTSYTVSEPLSASSIAGDVGNTVGLSSAPFEGIYRITLNQNDHTIKAVKVN
jgi:hypothetical protein